MPTVDLRFNCSDHVLATIDLLRGIRSRDDFILSCVQVGLGHFEEEAIKFHRERLYEVAAFSSDQFRKALENRELSKGLASHEVTRTKVSS